MVEGTDYAKPLTKLEASKLGGKKPTGITEVSDDLVKQFKDLKFTHISPSIETTKAGSKSFRVRFTGPIANDFEDIFYLQQRRIYKKSLIKLIILQQVIFIKIKLNNLKQKNNLES